MPADRLRGWLLPLAVTLLARDRAVLADHPAGRSHADSRNNGIVFDETYYAHDSWSLLHHGVEANGPMTGPGFVVHPPLGKWMMAVGEALFDHGKTVTFHHTDLPGQPVVVPVQRRGGRNPGDPADRPGSRRRMFRSTALGVIAGLLVALDGLEFVQSRTAMLDIFLMFWVLAAFGCLVVDRDDGRRRLAARLTAPLGPDDWAPVARASGRGGGPPGSASARPARPSGTARSTSPAFIILAVAWDVGARRTAGTRPGCRRGRRHRCRARAAGVPGASRCWSTSAPGPAGSCPTATTPTTTTCTPTPGQSWFGARLGGLPRLVVLPEARSGTTRTP